MRIVVHGQQAFGKAVLEALLKRGENVIAVYVAPEKPGAKADPLKEAALAAKLPVYQPDSTRNRKCGRSSKRSSPTFRLWPSSRCLFRKNSSTSRPTARSSITLRCCRPIAARARSTGRSSKARRKPGLSIFWPDNGLDTGDMLIQKKTPIGPTDTLGTVYFDRLFPMGVDAMLESVDLVKAGKAPRIKQDESQSHLRGPLRSRQCQDRLGQALGADRPADPRLQSGARSLDHARRQATEDLRRQAVAGERSEGHRRQARRDRRGRSGWLHRGLRRWALQGVARAARRRQEN